MSRFSLIQIEINKSENFPCYSELDFDRPTEYRIYEKHIDQYGNISNKLLMSCLGLEYARRFLRSCKLTEGIEIKD